MGLPRGSRPACVHVTPRPRRRSHPRLSPCGRGSGGGYIAADDGDATPKGGQSRCPVAAAASAWRGFRRSCPVTFFSGWFVRLCRGTGQVRSRRSRASSLIRIRNLEQGGGPWRRRRQRLTQRAAQRPRSNLCRRPLETACGHGLGRRPLGTVRETISGDGYLNAPWRRPRETAPGDGTATGDDPWRRCAASPALVTQLVQRKRPGTGLPQAACWLRGPGGAAGDRRWRQQSFGRLAVHTLASGCCNTASGCAAQLEVLQRGLKSCSTTQLQVLRYGLGCCNTSAAVGYRLGSADQQGHSREAVPRISTPTEAQKGSCTLDQHTIRGAAGKLYLGSAH
eukprot:138626-Chlamydomonas_euryale.AAC.8